MAATSSNADASPSPPPRSRTCSKSPTSWAAWAVWGAGEGQNLYNTDMKRELDHLGAFLHMAVDHAKKIGFDGQFFIEPKPKSRPSTNTTPTRRPASISSAPTI